MNRKRWSCTTIRCRKGWGKKHRHSISLGFRGCLPGDKTDMGDQFPAGVGIKTKRQK